MYYVDENIMANKPTYFVFASSHFSDSESESEGESKRRVHQTYSNSEPDVESNESEEELPLTRYGMHEFDATY